MAFFFSKWQKQILQFCEYFQNSEWTIIMQKLFIFIKNIYTNLAFINDLENKLVHMLSKEQYRQWT